RQDSSPRSRRRCLDLNRPWADDGFMGARLRLGPVSVSSRGRVGVRAGPVSVYGGGRRRRSSKNASSGDGLAALIAIAVVVGIVFFVVMWPLTLLGHAL